MDQDWEEYYFDLEEYESATGIDPEKEHDAATATAAAGGGCNEMNADDLSRPRIMLQLWAVVPF